MTTNITSILEHRCHEGDCCPVCTSNARAVAAASANTSFQQLSRPLGNETPEERHWRIRDTRESYEASHQLYWAIKECCPHLPQDVVWSLVTADYEKGVRVAQAYQEMVSNPDDEAVRAAYDAFMTLTDQHFDLITGAMGIQVDFVDQAEPYDSAAAMAMDLILGNHLYIATICIWPDSYHPVLGNERGGQYDRFRAVHDAFGHVAIGVGFDRHGEYASWLFHALVCGNEVPCSAVSSELHGINSTLWVTGRMPKAKAGILPADLRNPSQDCNQFGFLAKV